MLFSFSFEIGALILGVLYIGHLYFSDVLELIQIGREVEKEEKDKQNDVELREMTKHIYS